MADHDATSSDFIYEYDVFLSFRGETRYGFTGHLYSDLCKSGINAFIDEELRIGDEIGPILLETIENSRMSIIVLSENYASSSWCLDELLKIIECYDEKEQQVLAIFYKVQPSDVREQKNSYEAAMLIHEGRFGQDSEKVKAWRSALSRVCDLDREQCGNNMYESELIKKIVKDTLVKLPPLPSEIRHIVGFDSRFEHVESLIDIKSNNTVRILEIFGAGGIGKTTFAQDLYDKIKHQFDAACFLEKVREKSNKSIKGLENLQKVMLSEMGEETGIMIGSTLRGGFEIKRRLSHKRVLLVLDDVDSVKQLETLAGGGDWFGFGSRIIITTRDTSVLDRHVMNDVIIIKYEMEVLNFGESLKLFCWHAFNMSRPAMSRPAKNFASICSRAISYAKGSPLALKVIGSNLKGKSIEEWEKELEEYEKVANNEIQGVLERSYYSLFERDQKSFLDIACFFKGEKWEYVQRILKACDFFPVIRVFVSKCLVTIDKNGCLEMHDLIQGMGREIVRQESPSNPGKRSRLWSFEEILQVLEEDSGSSTIEGVMLHPPKLKKVDRWNNIAFKKMKNLRILIVRETIFSTGPNFLPNSLRLIDWKGYPSNSFPPNFYPQNIVDFKLPHSRLSLKKSFQATCFFTRLCRYVWFSPLNRVFATTKTQIFKDLTFIKFSQCQSITQIPDVSGAENLRVLTLDGCLNLVRFDKSVGFMPKLVYLSASECSALKSFVPKMYLPSLEVLSFNFCRRLEHFPHVMQKMDKPLKIRMINTAVKEFPKSIGNLTGLEYIDMSVCRELKDLSTSFLLLPNLVTLKIDGCSLLGGLFERFKKSLSVGNGHPNLVTLYLSEANLSDEDLYVLLENFPKLEDLNVSHNGFVSLPECIKGSLHLKSLNVSYCRNLTEISGLPSSIQKVDARHCRSLTSEASSVLWSKVKEIKRIQVVMPKVEIPEWFDCFRNEDIPFFWARRKFPVVALVFMFGEVKEDETKRFPVMEADKSYKVALHMFIDSQEISSKDYHYFSVGEDHLLLCDLRALYNDEDWQGLDACLGDDWKAVQVLCESPLILSRWGVYVYEEETNRNDIRFWLQHPNSSGEYMPSSHLVPKETLQKAEQDIRHLIANFRPGQIFGNKMPLIEFGETPDLPKTVVRSMRNAMADIGGEALASSYGASVMEESDWDVLLRLSNLAKENVPWGQIIDDSVLDGSTQSKRGRMFDQMLQDEVNFMKGKWGRWVNIDMPIILEECHSHKAPTRRYWGNLEIDHEEPTFNAVMKTRMRNNLQLQLGEQYVNLIYEAFPRRTNIVLLKCQRPSTEELASSSSHGEEYDDPELEALLRRIEDNAMSLNKSYGKMKASIVLMDPPVSDEYKKEAQIIRILQTWGILGILGSNLQKTPYGRLRVEDNNRRLSWTCFICEWCSRLCFNLLGVFIFYCFRWCYDQI